jgi:hypothetical protein
MRVAEKLDFKGLKIKKSFGNRKIIMCDEARHRIGKGLNPRAVTSVITKVTSRSYFKIKLQLWIDLTPQQFFLFRKIIFI